ncbi:transposase [Microbacterium abyssi]|uniref:transposase n=1 Tax=Microbacterium abyssi TaxID=2782166 RepID=UPI003BF5AE66
MPGPYPREFREDVVAEARSRESGVTIKQIAGDLSITEATLQNWLCQADADDGNRPGQTAAEAAEAAEARELRSGSGCSSRRTRSCGVRRVSVVNEPETRRLPKMTYPLVAGARRRGDSRDGVVSGSQVRPYSLRRMAG